MSNQCWSNGFCYLGSHNPAVYIYKDSDVKFTLLAYMIAPVPVMQLLQYLWCIGEYHGYINHMNSQKTTIQTKPKLPKQQRLLDRHSFIQHLCGIDVFWYQSDGHWNLGKHNQTVGYTLKCSTIYHDITYSTAISAELKSDLELAKDTSYFATQFDGIMPKGPYPPCLRMADRALLAGYPRVMGYL